MPGVTVNLSKSGVSTTLGVRGASITKGHGQTRTNVGIPGSGLSYNTVTRDKREPQTQPAGTVLGVLKLLGWGLLFLAALIALIAIGY